MLNLERADDAVIWSHAKTHGLVIVTLDADFSDLSVLRGHPPKVVWLRCGNSTVARLRQEIQDGLDSGSPREIQDVDAL